MNFCKIKIDKPNAFFHLVMQKEKKTLYVLILLSEFENADNRSLKYKKQIFKNNAYILWGLTAEYIYILLGNIFHKFLDIFNFTEKNMNALNDYLILKKVIYWTKTYSSTNFYAFFFFFTSEI